MSGKISHMGMGRAFGLVNMVCAAALAVGGGGGCRGGGGRRDAPAPSEAAPIRVVTAPVVRGSLAHTLEGLGTVQGLQSAQIRPMVDGLLQAVHFNEGQAVVAGESLAQIDPRPAEVAAMQARATAARSAAALELARLNLARNRALLSDRMVAQQTVDELRSAVQDQEGALLSAQAGVRQAALQLEYAQVLAPFDGVAGVRLVDPGNMVRAADPNGLVIITQMNPCAVMVSLPEDVLPALQAVAQAGPVAVSIFHRDGQRLLGEGRLHAIDNQIQAASGTLRLKVRVANPGGLMWPNQFVRARLQVGRRDGVLMVPAEAVMVGAAPTVWAVDSAGTAQARTVSLGEPEAGWAHIKSGLSEGEQVVIVGQHLLRQGGRVVVRPATPEDLPPAVVVP